MLEGEEHRQPVDSRHVLDTTNPVQEIGRERLLYGWLVLATLLTQDIPCVFVCTGDEVC